jgi:hypothetical protein
MRKVAFLSDPWVRCVTILLPVGKQTCASTCLEDEQEVITVGDGNDVDGYE